MNQPSIKKNIAFSTLYQILTMITPLITAPYVSRVLGKEAIGIYSYTSSYVTYFAMFAALGTASYGLREIARVRDDEYKRSKLFWEIELLSVFTTLVTLVFWGLWIFFNKQYQICYLILSLTLISTMFDISWFYGGLEQFQFTVIQNSIFKIVSVIAILTLVKGPESIYVYFIIMCSFTLLGNISMWIYLPRFVTKIKASEIKVKSHFKETIIYFIPTIATSVYTVLDKTLIGLITKDTSENAYYEQATKIINMCKALTFTSLNSVLGSRIAYLYVDNKQEEIKQKIDTSMDYILFIGLGICFGLIAVANRFVPLFFGEGYDMVTTLLKLMSSLVVIIGISGCLGSQYYTPSGRRTQSTKYIITGSVVNLILNLILIPKFKCVGAVIATIVAESTISFLYINASNGMYTFKELVHYSWKKIVAGIFMLVSISFMDTLFNNGIVALFVEVIAGVLIYCGVLYLLKDSFLFEVLNRLMNVKNKLLKQG